MVQENNDVTQPDEGAQLSKQEASVLFATEKTANDGENSPEVVNPEADKTVREGEKSRDKAPEDSDYDLKMPDGVELDKQMLDVLAPDFKRLGLSNEQAQKLVDKYIEVQAARGQAQNEKWGETITGWIEEAKSDKEIGGDKWEETVTAGRRAVEQFGTPDLREYLNASGGGAITLR